MPENKISPALTNYLDKIKDSIIDSLTVKIEVISKEEIPKIKSKIAKIEAKAIETDEILSQVKEDQNLNEERISKNIEDIEELDSRITQITKDNDLIEMKYNEAEVVIEANSKKLEGNFTEFKVAQNKNET